MTSFNAITPNQFELVFNLSKEIWNNNYRDMITQGQIDYMLNLMYNPEQLQKDLNEGYQWELIYHNNNLIGYLAYVIKEDNRVFLSKIYLKTEVQGLGLGKLALNRVKNYAKTNNCTAVYLTVNRGNEKGVRAYKRSGFKIIGEDDFDIGNGYVMNDYIFEYRF
ncbi:GNAT family N-acetyltransferase [Pontimicrobium sp. MEBiC01747]